MKARNCWTESLLLVWVWNCNCPFLCCPRNNFICAVHVLPKQMVKLKVRTVSLLKKDKKGYFMYRFSSVFQSDLVAMQNGRLKYMHSTSNRNPLILFPAYVSSVKYMDDFKWGTISIYIFKCPHYRMAFMVRTHPVKQMEFRV